MNNKKGANIALVIVMIGIMTILTLGFMLSSSASVGIVANRRDRAQLKAYAQSINNAVANRIKNNTDNICTIISDNLGGGDNYTTDASDLGDGYSTKTKFVYDDTKATYNYLNVETTVYKSSDSYTLSTRMKAPKPTEDVNYPTAVPSSQYAVSSYTSQGLTWEGNNVIEGSVYSLGNTTINGKFTQTNGSYIAQGVGIYFPSNKEIKGKFMADIMQFGTGGTYRGSFTGKNQITAYSADIRENDDKKTYLYCGNLYSNNNTPMFYNTVIRADNMVEITGNGDTQLNASEIFTNSFKLGGSTYTESNAALNPAINFKNGAEDTELNAAFDQYDKAKELRDINNAIYPWNKSTDWEAVIPRNGSGDFIYDYKLENGNITRVDPSTTLGSDIWVKVVGNNAIKKDDTTFVDFSAVIPSDSRVFFYLDSGATMDFNKQSYGGVNFSDTDENVKMTIIAEKGGSSVKIDKNAVLAACIYAPACKIELGNDSKVYGRIVAGYGFKASSGAEVHLKPFYNEVINEPVYPITDGVDLGVDVAEFPTTDWSNVGNYLGNK